MASFAVLTYNVWNGRALPHVPELMQEYSPDVVCLQEFPLTPDTIASLESGPYRLAEYSNSFSQRGHHYGVATFYNSTTLEHKESDIHRLPRSTYELMLMASPQTHNHRTILETRLWHKGVGIGFDVYNTHLTFHGSNKDRLKQIKKVLELTDNSGKIPAIIAGDFNYVYKRSLLEKLIFQHGVCEATSDILWTVETTVIGFWHLKMKPDYILYKGSQLRSLMALRIEETQSDHHPVLAVFSLVK